MPFEFTSDDSPIQEPTDEDLPFLTTLQLEELRKRLLSPPMGTCGCLKCKRKKAEKDE